MPVITISALEKKIDTQITGIREVQNESLSDYNQSLRSLGNKNVKQSSEKSIIIKCVLVVSEQLYKGETYVQYPNTETNKIIGSSLFQINLDFFAINYFLNYYLARPQNNDHLRSKNIFFFFFYKFKFQFISNAFFIYMLSKNNSKNSWGLLAKMVERAFWKF